jgi:hypothetical protein
MSSPLRVILPWMLCCLVAGPVQAAAVSYLLDQSNELDDGVNYLEVRITDGRDGAIDFAVEVLGPLATLAGDNFGIQSFGFNVVGDGFAEAGDITGLSDGWFAHQGKRMSGFGLFDITLMGKGWERLKTLRFSITGVDDDSPWDYAVFSTGHGAQGHAFFAAHVAGFAYDCITSAYFGGSAVVPLPPAAWLFVSGLAALLPFRSATARPALAGSAARR